MHHVSIVHITHDLSREISLEMEDYRHYKFCIARMELELEELGDHLDDDSAFRAQFATCFSRTYEDHILWQRTTIARQTFARITERVSDAEALRPFAEQYAQLIRGMEEHRRAGHTGGWRLREAYRFPEVRRVQRPSNYGLDPAREESWTATQEVPAVPSVEPPLDLAALLRRWQGLINDIPRWYREEDAWPEVETRQEVAARGIKLLKEHLTAEQLESYEQHRYFDVVGQSGKRYRINHGRQQNIYELNSAGEPVKGWCFLPQGNLCEGDTMLAQKLALQCQEKAALDIAHPFTVRSRSTGDNSTLMVTDDPEGNSTLLRNLSEEAPRLRNLADLPEWYFGSLTRRSRER